jgi:hypothetical protein
LNPENNQKASTAAIKGKGDMEAPCDKNFNVNGSEYFRTTATVGEKPDGYPLRKSFYGSSKKDAEAKRDEYMADTKRGNTGSTNVTDRIRALIELASPDDTEDVKAGIKLLAAGLIEQELSRKMGGAL